MLKMRMERADVSVEWITEQLKSISQSAEDPRDKLAAIDRLAHIIGCQTKPDPARDHHAQKQPTFQINLGLPEPKKKQKAFSSNDIIEAKAIANAPD